MKKIKTFQSLSVKQWMWLWQAYWYLWPVVFRIKFKQLFTNAAWLRKKITFVQNIRQGGTLPSLLPLQLHESVRLAARLHFFKAECLSRSIVLADMLHAKGIHGEVFIGVQKVGRSIASHAWVEVDGVMIAESESVQLNFTPLKKE